MARGLIGGTNRELEQMFNAIDINLNPINIHALVRSTPLATVYNYCYTFEQMICSLFETSREAIEDLDIIGSLLWHCLLLNHYLLNYFEN